MLWMRALLMMCERERPQKGKMHTGIVDSQSEVGGWPLLQNGSAPKDADHDGIADAWEVKHKLDPANGG